MRTPLKSNRTARFIRGISFDCTAGRCTRHAARTGVGIAIAIAPAMFNVSPFASLSDVNRVLAAWGLEATGYEPARGGVENSCLIVDTPAHRYGRVVLRLHRPEAGARLRLELAALEHLSGL